MYFQCRESHTTVESVIESNVFHGIQQIRQTCEHIDCGNGLRTEYAHSYSDFLLLEIVGIYMFPCKATYWFYQSSFWM